jgi:hypothetical protein
MDALRVLLHPAPIFAIGEFRLDVCSYFFIDIAIRWSADKSTIAEFGVMPTLHPLSQLQ